MTVSIHRVRVGYADTDQAGVCHHAAYLRFLEQARVEHWRERGLDYRGWERSSRLGLPVVDVHVRYRAPARFDDLLEIETWVGQSSLATLRYDSLVRVGERVLTEAQIKVACVGLDDGQLRRMPPEVIEAARR